MRLSSPSQGWRAFASAFVQNRGAAAVMRTILQISRSPISNARRSESIADQPRGGAGDRTDRIGQIHHAGGDGQPERDRRGHILTIEDPIEFVHASKSV